MTREVRTIAPSASLDEAIRRMEEADIRHLPVLEGDHVVGMISERDLLAATGWLPPSVREVLDAPEGNVGAFMHCPVVALSPQDTLVTAALRLIEWTVGCLPVLDDGALVGVVSDTDVLRAFVAAGGRQSAAPAADPPVAAVMTREVIRVTSDTEADEAVDLCRANHIRHLPICDGDRLVGIVSDRDLRLLVGRGQLEGTRLGELSAGECRSIDPGSPLSRAARILAEQRIGALPVVDGSRLVGLLSTTDVLRHCARSLGERHGCAPG